MFIPRTSQSNMNKFAICLCLFLGCLAFTQAQIFRRDRYYGNQRPIRYCYDYRGRPVAPGQQFSIDGCNTCSCGTNGQGGCTLMLCPSGGSGSYRPQRRLG